MIRVYLLFGLDSRRSDKNGTQQACVALVVRKRVRDASIYASKKYRSSFYS